jgi:hypothetical protein
MFSAMATTLDDLITAIMRLPPEDLARLRRALNCAHDTTANAVRDGAATYQTEAQGESMTQLTVALPDDLAERARNAGLLAGKSLEEIIRRALEEHHDAAVAAGIAPPTRRRLVEEDGFLVAEALPGEEPITTEEVKKILDDMEW